MKKLFTIALLAVALNAEYLAIGHIVCQKEKWLHDTSKFAANNDLTSLKSYLKMGRCSIVKQPIPVSVINEQDDIVEVFILGRHFWTIKEAITQ